MEIQFKREQLIIADLSEGTVKIIKEMSQEQGIDIITAFEELRLGGSLIEITSEKVVDKRDYDCQLIRY